MTSNPCATPCDIRARVPGYIRANLSQVAPLYRLEQAGQLADGQADGAAFMARQMAVGASELRDLVASAYREAAGVRVGWPAVAVADVEAGTVDPWVSMIGSD